MAEDPIRAYLDTKRNFDELTQQVGEMIGRLQAAAHVLQNWEFATVPGPGGWPIHLVSAPSTGEWPTVKQVQDTLSNWHKAKLAAQNAWQKVPARDQQGLQPPPVR